MSCYYTPSLYEACVKNPDLLTRIVLFEKVQCKGGIISVYVIESDISKIQNDYQEFSKLY